MARGIRSLREMHGMTLRELAKRADIEVSTLSRLERQGFPRIDQVYRIAQVFELKRLTDLLEFLFPELKAPHA